MLKPLGLMSLAQTLLSERRSFVAGAPLDDTHSCHSEGAIELVTRAANDK